MYIHTLIVLLSVSLSLGAEDICCVCLPKSLCEEGAMTSIAKDLVGSTPEAIIQSRRTINDPQCKDRKFLTCCKVPWASDRCSTEASTASPMTNIPEKTPWAAYLFRDFGREEPVASATLIHPQALFVPAHVLTNVNTTRWRISLGDEQIDRMFNRYKNMAVKTIIPHPEYTPGSTANDIAVVILEDKVRNPKLYSPIMIPRRTKHLDYKTCTITGAETDVIVKQKTIRTSYVPKKQCRRSQRKKVPAKSLKFVECVTTRKEEDLCKMKAGASVTCMSKHFKEPTLLGIITKNNACDPTQRISVFTPTRYHIQWARRIIQKTTGKRISFPRRKRVGRKRPMKFRKNRTRVRT